MNFELDYRTMFHTNWLKMTALYDNVSKHTTDMCNKEAGDKFFKKLQYFCCTNNKKMTLSPHPLYFRVSLYRNW
jgi:hypothetical protein